MKKSRILLVTIITVCLLTISLAFIHKPVDARISLWSRAGGGESYDDGGFDSFDTDAGDDWSDSSDSYYGGSTGDSISGSDVCSSFCCFAIVAIIVIVFLVIKAKKGGKSVLKPSKGSLVPSSSSAASNVTNQSMNSSQISEQLNAMKKIDPKFDQQKFKGHVKKVFMAVQQGWTERDQSCCRPFMGEDAYQSHQMQIDNMKKNKVINVLENIVVGSVDFARIDLGDEFHKITMKVRASMKDYKVKEDAQDKIIEGDKKQTPPFTEYWAFIRKSNLKTKVKDGIIDRKCPNCGAPIKVDVAGVCKYCEANVVNGDYDWVLSEIIQKSEWQA
ncbi:MAG: Tim44-like domain-containing protein [Patescibacteria group bacterium]|nr:Tim44-like domain-containing protein [Patescibacteria group bacterium]